MTQPRDLVLLTQAQRVLAQASTVDEVKELRDKAAAVRAYVQKARLGRHLVIEAALVRMRAERRLGEMLGEARLANSAPGNQHTDPKERKRPEAVLLKDLGITKNESSRSQRIAELPDATFEQYLAQCVHNQREPTFTSLLRLLRCRSTLDTSDRPPRSKGASLEGGALDSLPEGEFATILAIPPWPNRTAGRPSLTTDALCALPVDTRCGQHAHIYIWTDSRFLIDGFDVMDAWGFGYRTAFVVVYEQAMPEAPWDQAHHFLLCGQRGQLRFRQHSGHSWLACARPAPDAVPEEVMELIEAVSPEPYLLLFGSQDPPRATWTSYSLPPIE